MKKILGINNKAKDVLWLCIIAIVAVFFSNCANEGALSGGAKDSTPPKLLWAKPAQKTTNFSAKEIVLKFDENINSAINYSEILISPPLKEMPIINVINKKVKIKLKEPLLPNTTYSFNFGDAIKDINESNPAGNLSYVVSTGSYIDSAFIQGYVFMANDLKPAENYLVVLYKSSEKKDFTKDKPLYFTRTDKSGHFKLDNLPEVEFDIYALNDKNLNYYFDLPNEEIAFSDTTVFAKTQIGNNDSTNNVSIGGKKSMDRKGQTMTGNNDIVLKAFLSSNNNPRQTDAENPIKGKIVFTYNSPINIWEIKSTPKIEKQKAAINTTYDTVTYWYSTNYIDTVDFFTKYADTAFATTRIKWNDSLKISKYETRKFSQSANNKNDIDKKSKTSPPPLAIQSPLQAYKIVFPVPIDSIFLSKEAVFFNDSTKKLLIAKMHLVGDNKDGISFTQNLEEGQKYRLHLPDSLLLFFNGEYNNEKNYFLATGKLKEFGNVQLKVEISDAKDFYIIRLLNSNKEVVREFFTNGKTNFTEEVDNLPQGKYTMQAVKDVNANARWDTGDFSKRQQPEAIITFKEEHELKGGWDLEIKIKL